uniref:Cation-transporting P-type ATPase C-terminal domain-containing protein n=1 Tax=Meloidogyne incognita TaxID=6306 RepID=A0A914M6W1_MELIC
MCSFIKEEENNENNNLDKENNFVDLREEHLMEFEEQFLRFCVQRKRCLALAVNSTPPPINENNNQNNLKNKNFCFVGLFAFEDVPLNIKYLNKLDRLIENGPKIIFIGDEHPALLIAKIMELNEKRPQKLINNNILNNCPFIIGNTAKIENSENNMERGINENDKENSFLHQLQNQLLRRLKNRKNVDFVSTSTTTSISTSTTLFNSKVNNKIINGNVKEKLEVFEEENIKWPIDGESFSQMSTKEIHQLLAEQFNSNKNNFVKNKFPLSFSKLSCEQITLIIKELQSFGHKVTFVGDVQNSINESQSIKQANLSIGIINYSNKLNNYSFNSFDVLIKCLEDGSGLVKLIVGIKEFGVGMKINLIRSLSLTLSQAPALSLPFLLSPLSDIPPIILPIHIVLVAFLFQLQYCIGFAFTPFDSNNYQHSLPTIYFNLILASPLLAFSSLFNYWNTLYSQNIYLEPNNDVKEFFSPFPINSTISSTILQQQLNLNEASTIWLFTLLFIQHLHILICIGFTNVFCGNILKSLKFIILWICIFLFNILLLLLFIYLPGLRNFFQLTPPSSQNFWWWIVILIVGIVFVFLNILFRFLLNNNAFKKSKFYKTILSWHNKQEDI